MSRSMQTCLAVAFVCTIFATYIQALTVVRGPYLQMVTPTGATVRWRTDVPATGVVRYGTQRVNLTSQKSETAATTEHIVALTGLTNNTKYYYVVGTSTETSAAADSNFYILTQPQTGMAHPARIWLISDFGQGSAAPRSETVQSYVAFNHVAHADLIISDGDQAEDGLESEYQSDFFDPLKSILCNTPIYTAMGNHERITSKTDTTKPYFKMISLPANGEMGGIASGTEAYYSFNYGNFHFICLSSEINDDDENGPQQTWLKSDLAATASSQLWRIVFVHRPFHSRGHHNFETSSYNSWRQTFLPVLERAGVDLIIQGHNHIYERTYLLDSLYGTYDDVTQSNKIDAGPGPYTKSVGPHKGEIFLTVTGAGYAYSTIENGGASPLCIKALANSIKGSVIMDVAGQRLHCTFLDNTGMIQDTFSITKTGGPTTAVRAPQMQAPLTSVQVRRVSGGIRFTIAPAASGNYRFTVFNSAGRCVMRSNGYATREKMIFWRGADNNAGNGVFLVSLATAAGNQTSKIVLPVQP